MNSKNQKIGSFEKVWIKTSNMCGVEEYEAIRDGSKVRVTAYSLRHGGELRVPVQTSVCGADYFLDLLNRCGLLGWDGFYGRRPEGLLDGTDFSMEAFVDGRVIHASGSANFPEGYHELMDSLFKILQDGE